MVTFPVIWCCTPKFGFVDLVKLFYFGNYSHIISKHDKTLELTKFVKRNKSILLNLL